MSALLPRLTAGSVGVVLALAVLGAPTAALAAPGDRVPAAGQVRAGSAAGLPAEAADRAQAADRAEAADRAQAVTAGVGSAGGAAAGRSTATVSRPEPAQAAAKQAATAKKAAEARKAAAAGKAAAAKRSAEVRKAAAQKAAAAQKDAEARKNAEAKKAAGEPDAAGASSESAKGGADPRGNNGTFKVDGPLLDTSHGNEPQVDCAFRLNFFGYDAGQLATITFTAIAPTPGASTTVDGRQVISTTAAKGGLYGGSYPTTGTWTAADLGLDPTQAQHVKVSVESFNADGSEVPGGAKHKVFWLHPCATPAAAEPTSVAPAVLPDAAPVMGPRPISGAPVAQPVMAAPAALPAPAAVPAGLPFVGPVAAPQTGVLGTTLHAQAAGPVMILGAAAQVLPAAAAQPLLPHGHARSAARPAVLPFTGSGPLLGMLVGGLIALVGGAGMVAAARRSA